MTVSVNSGLRRAMRSIVGLALLISCGGGEKATSDGATNQGGSVGVSGEAAVASSGRAGNGAAAAATGGSVDSAAGATQANGGSAGNAQTGSGGSAAAAGGTAGATTDPGMPIAGRVRTIIAFDDAWLFNQGNVTGADQATFADAAWRALSVPHDWSIEGPFDQSAPSTGRGGYLPTGISWYRKHFTLPSSASARKVFIELDGVMANSDVYVNGAHIANHPYGYVSFRYDITANVKFGSTDNVVSVKTDTTAQPASRFYAGAGIYRHVRLIAADPVHVEQYATFVTTPAPSAASAVVHVTTTVTNSGAIAQSVSVQGIVQGPSGPALAPVTTPAQSIAAGASGSFGFDVTVASPKLWDLSAPNLYQLLTNVRVGGVTVDDDLTSFGIREIKFDNGMTLNGKSVKFQGVANHQDFHGLGLAAPQRAVQRRLAQLKALGVNAIRTAHEPPSPEFLDLTDRMGFLVLDEFSDVWTLHKYTDVGDYAAAFNKTAVAPTGMPPVPGVTTGATWWQVDLTGFIMRDRNHPSVALYSLGNEIHDSLATRTPILTKMIAISHALDSTRADTQALLQPATAGDVGAATNTLLDVWGDNYHVDDCLTALPKSPTKSGLLTEMGTETSTWATVLANPGLTGEFMWTGVDYLGESDGAWPQVGSSAGIMDELGTVKTLGYSWQKIWGAPTTTPPVTGTTASKVVLTPDRATVLADWNDVAFVAAAISDAAGHLVTSSASVVTFTIAGPGKIIAVDSGSMSQESFRGVTRKAFKGLAFAIVQATGSGAITVSAAVDGLTGASATLQGAAGTFVPCTGTCD